VPLCVYPVSNAWSTFILGELPQLTAAGGPWDHIMPDLIAQSKECDFKDHLKQRISAPRCQPATHFAVSPLQFSDREIRKVYHISTMDDCALRYS
jgi:hypothetical protein